MHLINHRIDKFFWFTCFLIMSLYILHEHSTSGVAIDLDTMMARHRNFINGNSEFFNPWQYRILAPFMLEGLVQIFIKISPGAPEVLPYLFLRFLQNMILLYIAFYFYRELKISNPVILFAGMLLLCFNISNSVFRSDLSFNTYFDVIFYLLAGWAIVTNRFIWIIPITFFAALNRETSGFIPLMLVAAFTGKDWKNSLKERLVIGGISLALFAACFVTIRLYYGYQEAKGIHGITSPIDYLSFNFTFLRMYPQLFGTLALIPVVVIICFNKIPRILRNWFWLIVPSWILIHLIKSITAETRLFLVPHALIFIPAMLYLAEYYVSSNSPPQKERM
ncbi:MAG: hypothetical protein WEB30_01435 [Cyclobacteriaceae bacterium]